MSAARSSDTGNQFSSRPETILSLLRQNCLNLCSCLSGMVGFICS